MSKTVKYALIVVAAILVTSFFVWRNREELPSLEDAPPPPQTGEPGSADENKPLLASEEPARTAIEARAIAIYNSAKREQVFSRNNTRENVFAGLTYRSGVRTVLQQVLASGNADEVPIIPPIVNPQYAKRMEAVKDVPGFEDTTATGNFDLAIDLWRDALDFTSVGGPNLWPPNMEQLMAAGLFYRSHSGDRNMSERYDSYCKDMVILCRNIAAASRSADSQFRSQAIEDLNAAGWNIVG